MTCLKAAVLTVVAAALCAPAQATQSVTGRWAADAAACDGGFFAQTPLVVTTDAVRWQGDSCRIGRMYKAGEAVYIQALCWGADGERSVPVSLHPRAGKLSLTWDRARKGELQRCH